MWIANKKRWKVYDFLRSLVLILRDCTDVDWPFSFSFRLFIDRYGAINDFDSILFHQFVFFHRSLWHGSSNFILFVPPSATIFAFLMALIISIDTFQQTSRLSKNWIYLLLLTFWYDPSWLFPIQFDILSTRESLLISYFPFYLTVWLIFFFLLPPSSTLSAKVITVTSATIHTIDVTLYFIYHRKYIPYCFIFRTNTHSSSLPYPSLKPHPFHY